MAVKWTPVTPVENFYRCLGTFFGKTEREIVGDLNGAKFHGNLDYMYVF